MKLNCILVDDDPSFRILIKKMIEEDSLLNLAGIAENGEQAMELLSTKKIDLVFLDIQMPDMTGFDVLDKVKAIDPTQVIITSGSAEHGIKAFDYGITDYLVKPFTNKRFKEAVNRVVRNASRNQYTTTLINKMLEKVVEYMYTRDVYEYEPLPFRDSKLGYIYPMLSANLDFQREEKALDILNTAVQEGFLTSDFIDSFYTCNSCSNSHLHIRESCPGCQSRNIQSEEQVHHFSCAYVGPLSDFQTNGGSREMICPKCEKRLNHIGVDYDRPSVVFTCNNCTHIFQDPVVRAKCLGCESDTNVENLVKKTLHSYQLTNLGRDAATGKVTINLKELDDMVDIIDKTYFEKVLIKETERMKEAQFDSTIAAINLQNIPELYDRIGNQASKRLLRELFDMINGETGRADEVVFQNMTTVWILFTEKDLNAAETILNRIVMRLKEMLNDNFEDFSLKTGQVLKPVSDQIPAFMQIEQLTGKESRTV